MNMCLHIMDMFLHLSVINVNPLAHACSLPADVAPW